MIKKHPIISFIIAFIIFVAIFIGGFAVYDSVFPKAPPFYSLEIDEIDKITISNGVSEQILSDMAMEVLDVLLNFDVKSTRIASVNDVPNVDNYYKITIYNIDGHLDYYYIYRKSSITFGTKYYMEQPYVGVYSIREDTYRNILGFL